MTRSNGIHKFRLNTENENDSNHTLAMKPQAQMKTWNPIFLIDYGHLILVLLYPVKNTVAVSKDCNSTTEMAYKHNSYGEMKCHQ